MVGGKNFEKKQFNVAVQGKRQPGSSFSRSCSPPPSPRRVPGEGVQERSGEAEGRRPDMERHWARLVERRMRLRPATEQSVNSVFAHSSWRSVPQTLSRLPRSSVWTRDRAGPAIALGGLKHGVSPSKWRVPTARCRGGRRAKPFAISSVSGPDGKVLSKTSVKAQSDRPGSRLSHHRHPPWRDRAGTGNCGSDRPASRGKTGTTRSIVTLGSSDTRQISPQRLGRLPDSQREMKSSTAYP